MNYIVNQNINVGSIVKTIRLDVILRWKTFKKFEKSINYK